MDVILETKCGAEKHDALKSMKADWSTEACATDAFHGIREVDEGLYAAAFHGHRQQAVL